MTEYSDRELVRMSRGGDKEAFGCLMERYQDLAGRVALRMLSAPDAAEDVVQEAMLQAYLSLKDLRNEESFRSWLYGIVLNIAKGYLRDQTRRSGFHKALSADELENIPDADDNASDPQQIAVERELHSLVLNAFEELPPAHRESARMYYFESLTLHEITAITGAAEGAIKVRLHRARNQLRGTLQTIYPEHSQEPRQKKRRGKMIKANVVDIVRKGEQFTVILQDESGEKMLPIWIGPAEGTAIALGLRAYPTARPLTYDFLAHLLEELGASMVEARVETLKNEIFYGVAKVQIGKIVKEVDARPSDVLALAVRTGSPIYVAEEIMQQAGQDQPAYENQFGQLVPGAGVEAILKEFEQEMKRVLPPHLRDPESQDQP